MRNGPAARPRPGGSSRSAAGTAELRVGDPGAVAVGPAVVAAGHDRVDFVRREVVAEQVAAVVARPELAAAGRKGQADTVAQPPGEERRPTAGGGNFQDGRAARILLDAGVATRTGRNVKISVASHDHAAGPVPLAGGQIGGDHLDPVGAQIPVPVGKSQQAAVLGDHQVGAGETETVGTVETGGEVDPTVGYPVVVAIGKHGDFPHPGQGDVEIAGGAEGEHARPGQAGGEDRDLPAGDRLQGASGRETAAPGRGDLHRYRGQFAAHSRPRRFPATAVWPELQQQAGRDDRRTTGQGREPAAGAGHHPHPEKDQPERDAPVPVGGRRHKAQQQGEGTAEGDREQSGQGRQGAGHGTSQRLAARFQIGNCAVPLRSFRRDTS